VVECTLVIIVEVSSSLRTPRASSMVVSFSCEVGRFDLVPSVRSLVLPLVWGERAINDIDAQGSHHLEPLEGRFVVSKMFFRPHTVAP